MKTKKLTPRNSAPVQRENTATVARDGNALWVSGPLDAPPLPLFAYQPARIIGR